MINKLRNTVFSKLFIILFYFSILMFFLYIPKIYDFFVAEKKVINVFAYTDMISKETVDEFESQTGIKINLKYFDNVEELLAKFKINKGKGYDLVATISDYAVELLSYDGLLHKIDLSKISNFDKIDKRLIGHFFDPENKYSLPYVWSVDGIIFKKDKIKKYVKEVNWDLVFKKPKDYKISMLDLVRENIFLAAIHIFGDVKNLSDEKLNVIQDLLIKQKSWVEVYMLGSLQYYLLGDVVPLAVTSSAFARKLMEVSDKFDFVVPKDGSLLLIDNLAIPATSEKVELVHKFMNFLISRDICFINSQTYGYNPANKQAYSRIDEKFKNNPSFFPDDEMFDKLYVIDNQIDSKKIEKLWLQVRLS